MTAYDRGDIVLVDLPYSDLSGVKRRPAVVVNAPHPSIDLFLLPITSQLEHLQPGEFVLQNWHEAGLLFPSAVKRGLFTLEATCVSRRLGHLSQLDLQQPDKTLLLWLGLSDTTR